MLRIKKKVLGLSLSLLTIGISQNSFAEGEIIGSASSIPSTKHIIMTLNPQDSYINEKLSFHLDSLKVEQIEEAALAGDPLAQHRLGNIYRFGKGVTRSDIVALMWYTISFENGKKDAIDDRNFTANYMAEDQIILATEMANRWLSENN